MGYLSQRARLASAVADDRFEIVIHGVRPDLLCAVEVFRVEETGIVRRDGGSDAGELAAFEVDARVARLRAL